MFQAQIWQILHHQCTNYFQNTRETICFKTIIQIVIILVLLYHLEHQEVLYFQEFQEILEVQGVLEVRGVRGHLVDSPDFSTFFVVFSFDTNPKLNDVKTIDVNCTICVNPISARRRGSCDPPPHPLCFFAQKLIVFGCFALASKYKRTGKKDPLTFLQNVS